MERLTVKKLNGLICLVDNKEDTKNRARKKLYEYEDAEEQGLLLRFPCKIGDDVYIIPSETNYDLNILSKREENNRVYHQKVARITFTKNGWYVECDKDIEYGTDRICIEQHFGITWFLTQEEAERALKEMEKKV